MEAARASYQAPGKESTGLRALCKFRPRTIDTIERNALYASAGTRHNLRADRHKMHSPPRCDSDRHQSYPARNCELAETCDEAGRQANAHGLANRRWHMSCHRLDLQVAESKCL